MGQFRQNLDRVPAASDHQFAFSSIWKFWVHRDDAYLTANTLGKVLKYSLHQSGPWRYAYHDTVKLNESEDRKRFGWRPKEIFPGTRIGPSVIVPSTNVPAPMQEPCPPNVRWLPEPPPDRKLVISTYVVRRQRKVLLPDTVHVEAGLLLRTLGLFVVASSLVEYPKEERSVIVGRTADLRITASAGTTEMWARMFDMRATPGGSHGQPVVWDLTVTSDHFHVEAEPTPPST